MPAAQSCSHFVNILVRSGSDSLTLSVRCEYHRSGLMFFKDILTLNTQNLTQDKLTSPIRELFSRKTVNNIQPIILLREISLCQRVKREGVAKALQPAITRYLSPHIHRQTIQGKSQNVSVYNVIPKFTIQMLDKTFT